MPIADSVNQFYCYFFSQIEAYAVPRPYQTSQRRILSANKCLRIYWGGGGGGFCLFIVGCYYLPRYIWYVGTYSDHSNWYLFRTHLAPFKTDQIHRAYHPSQAGAKIFIYAHANRYAKMNAILLIKLTTDWDRIDVIDAVFANCE